MSTTRAAPGAGTHALAIAATFNCSRKIVQIALSPCALPVPSDMRGKTFSFQVFLDGPALLDGPKEQVAEVLTTTALTSPIPFVVGQWIPVSFPITDSSAATATTLEYSLFMIPSGPPPDNVCMQWQGTIYLDAFSLN